MAFRPHLGSRRVAGSIVLLNPLNGIGREATACCNDQHVHTGIIPKGHLLLCRGHLWQSDASFKPMFTLGDDAKSQCISEAIDNDPGDLEVAATVGALVRMSHPEFS